MTATSTLAHPALNLPSTLRSSGHATPNHGSRSNTPMRVRRVLPVQADPSATLVTADVEAADDTNVRRCSSATVLEAKAPPALASGRRRRMSITTFGESETVTPRDSIQQPATGILDLALARQQLLATIDSGKADAHEWTASTCVTELQLPVSKYAVLGPCATITQAAIEVSFPTVRCLVVAAPGATHVLSKQDVERLARYAHDPSVDTLGSFLAGTPNEPCVLPSATVASAAGLLLEGPAAPRDFLPLVDEATGSFVGLVARQDLSAALLGSRRDVYDPAGCGACGASAGINTAAVHVGTDADPVGSGAAIAQVAGASADAATGLATLEAVWSAMSRLPAAGLDGQVAGGALPPPAPVQQPGSPLAPRRPPAGHSLSSRHHSHQHNHVLTHPFNPHPPSAPLMSQGSDPASLLLLAPASADLRLHQAVVVHQATAAAMTAAATAAAVTVTATTATAADPTAVAAPAIASSMAAVPSAAMGAAVTVSIGDVAALDASPGDHSATLSRAGVRLAWMPAPPPTQEAPALLDIGGGGFGGVDEGFAGGLYQGLQAHQEQQGGFHHHNHHHHHHHNHQQPVLATNGTMDGVEHAMLPDPLRSAPDAFRSGWDMLDNVDDALDVLGLVGKTVNAEAVGKKLLGDVAGLAANIAGGSSGTGWVFKYLYDGDCSICRTFQAVLEKLDNGIGRVTFVDIAGQGFNPLEHGGINYKAAMETIHILSANGQIFKGITAVIKLLAAVDPEIAARMGVVTAILPLLSLGYMVVSKNRHLLSGVWAKILRATKVDQAVFGRDILEGWDERMEDREAATATAAAGAASPRGGGSAATASGGTGSGPAAAPPSPPPLGLGGSGLSVRLGMGTGMDLGGSLAALGTKLSIGAGGRPGHVRRPSGGDGSPRVAAHGAPVVVRAHRVVVQPQSGK